MFRILLYPLSLVYGLVVFIRNLMFDMGILKSEQFNIPVIAVGNITVGGTGKTPHVEYLANLLKGDSRVAVLSRGYKRKTKGFFLASNSSASIDIGDEPAQIKQKFPDIEVAVHEKRIKGIEQLIKLNSQVIILDDAYQHRYVKPGLSILLIDFNRRIDKDFLLPFGNLRESASEIQRADIIIVTKTPLDLTPIDRRLIIDHVRPFPYQELYFTGFEYGNIAPVFNVKTPILNDFYKNHEIFTILLITGIAFSKPIFNQLKSFSADIRHIEFTDHSDYTNGKIQKITKQFKAIDNDKKIIITTEKDAIKFRETIPLNDWLCNYMYFVPIEVKFIDNKEDFNQQIIDYVKKNKRNN